MQSEILIQTFKEQTRQILSRVEALQKENLQTLTWRAQPHSWNILECIEHLNLYGDFYLPEIEHKIQQSSSTPDLLFKKGILGSYFAKSMQPKEKLNKMKTFADKNPIDLQLDKDVLARSIAQQHKLLALLEKSRSVSLNKVKINISISKFIKLKLGDTFHFFINHILRHIQQIDNIQKAMQ